MTGAGSSTVALSHEQSFLGTLNDSNSDGTPEYYGVGRDPTISDGVGLENELQRLRDAGKVEAAESVAQNFSGSVTVEATVSQTTHTEIEKFVFNDGTGFAPGRPNFGRLFAGVDYLTGTAERELRGCIPQSYEVNYEENGMVTYSLGVAYAEEKHNTSITPSSIIKASDGSSVPFHGATLAVDGTTVQKLSSATLSIENIARFQRGAGRIPVDAVIGAVETTLDLSAVFTGPSKLKAAYGGSNVSTPQDQLSSVSGSLALAVGGSTVTTYDFPQLKPDSYSWSDLITADSDVSEEVTYHVNGGIGVS